MKSKFRYQIKKKNQNYKPLDPPPDKKALYKQILTWTRNKQTFWYIGSQEKDYVCYVLQGNDGHKILFKHYLTRPNHSQYEFVNFPGRYTYQECKALEDAILDAGFKKPLSPSEYREKQLEKHKREKAEKKVRIERYKQYWQKYKQATMDGKCIWWYVSVSNTSRSFETTIDNEYVILDITINIRTKQPIYHISSQSIESLYLDNKEGNAFERFLLATCSYSPHVSNNKEARDKTSYAYFIFKEQQKTVIQEQQKIAVQEQKSELKRKRKAILNELREILLKDNVLSNGCKKSGMTILAEDQSGKLLQSVCKTDLPSSLKQFSDNMKWLLDLLGSSDDIAPEFRKLYQDLLNLYVVKWSSSSSKVVFPDKTIKKYTKKIKSFQVPQVSEEKSTANNKNIVAHSDASEVKAAKRRKHINAHDFIIRRSVLTCMYRNHSVINIDAVITVVDRNCNFTDITASAGYCQQCQKFFILESDYAQIALRGEPLCTVLDEKRYRDNYKNDGYFKEISAWPEKSILGKCGYSVSQTNGLSTLERRKILANVIDREILSKIEIRSHLKRQISLHERHPIAVDKWESDEDFVAAYNKGYYAKYGVNTLRRM